jgi:hypothetical protein
LRRQGNAYYMTVGAGIARVGGCVLLYRSDDLKHWTYLHQLTSGQWNGKPTPNPCDDGEMWECPDFFQLDGGHVLIYSTLGKVFWQSGSLDAATMLFHPVKTGELDLGAFYAPKTQLDANGRRILWGWITEQRPEAQYSAAGWAGMMSLPRVLHLDKSGTLRMEILPTLATLRSSPVPPQETRAGIWIAEASDFNAKWWIGDDGLRELGPVDEVGIIGPGEALGFAELVGAVVERDLIGRAFDDAGVDCVDAPADCDRCSGEAAGCVRAAGCWGHGERLMRPVNHVGADGVIPAHVPPDGGLRVVLEEHVVVAAEVDGAVGIVHPVGRGKQMELRPLRIEGERRHERRAILRDETS